jgi:hypothetical protein
MLRPEHSREPWRSISRGNPLAPDQLLTGMDVLGTLILIAIGILVYFLPSFVGRKKRRAEAIFALNLFLGWTLVGWAAALTWALTKDSKKRAG